MNVLTAMLNIEAIPSNAFLGEKKLKLDFTDLLSSVIRTYYWFL